MSQYSYRCYALFFSFAASLLCGFSCYTMQKSMEQQQYEQQEKQADRCSMCWETIPQEQDALVQLTCHPNHIFHKPCLESWFNERIQQNQTLACLYCNQELAIGDRAKLNLNEMQTAPDQEMDQEADNDIQDFQNIIQQERQQLMRAIAFNQANGQPNEQDVRFLMMLLGIEEEQEEPQPKEVHIRIALKNAKAHLPPLEQLLQTMKEEVYRTLGPSTRHESIERFIAQLPDTIQDIQQNLAIMLNRQDIQDIEQHRENEEQLYRAFCNLIREVLSAYIQVFNIQHIPYEQSHIHFTLIGRIVTLLSIHALPALKFLLKDIRAIEVAHEGNGAPEVKFTTDLQLALDPLTDQDISKLVKTLFTAPLDRHNWDATKALLVNSINQLQADNRFADDLENIIDQFVQLNPKVQESLKHLSRQHKYLLLKKNILHKLNNPWVRGVALTLCSAIVAKLCQHIHKALL